MRVRVSMAVLVLLTATTVPVYASGFDDKTFDQQSIDALVLKISQAQPREQYFLYAQLMHQMTEVSLRQYNAGQEEKATGMLKEIQVLAHKIHLTIADDNKRLKDSELLLRHTAFRLSEMLHNSSFEDREIVKETLVQVNQAQSETMLQVFRK